MKYVSLILLLFLIYNNKMEETFSNLTDDVISNSTNSINWIYVSIGLFVGIIIYFILRVYVFKKEKNVTFECDNGMCMKTESNTHNVDDPKNINYCDGEKCYI